MTRLETPSSTPVEVQPQHVQWLHNLLGSLKLNGVWTIPSNGAVVMRISRDAVVFMRDPHDQLMAEVRAYSEAAGDRKSVV